MKALRSLFTALVLVGLLGFAAQPAEAQYVHHYRYHVYHHYGWGWGYGGPYWHSWGWYHPGWYHPWGWHRCWHCW